MSELLSSLISSLPKGGQTASEEGINSDRKTSRSPLLDVLRSADLRRVLPGLALSSLIINLLALGLPLGLLQIMDRVMANQSVETLVLLVIGIVCVLVLEEVLRLANSHVTGWLGARFEHIASINALTRLMHVPLRYLQREEPGVHVERIAGAGKVGEFYSGQALLIAFDMPFVVLFMAIIYLIGGWVVLVPLAVILLFAYIISRFGTWLRQQVEQRQVMDARRNNFLIEVLSGFHSVKTLSMEAQMERRHELLQASNSEINEKLAFGHAMAGTVSMLFSQVMIVGIVFAGAWGVISGKMTPGGLAACMMLSVRALQPLRRSLAVWLRYQAFVAARARLQEVADMPTLHDQPDQPLPPVRTGIELKNISLVRNNGTLIFDNLSLQITANECIGIRGDSGSGKTSLLGLISGIEQPSTGTILVDGRAYDEFSADSVQQQIALIPQYGTIIAGSILENMTMFDDSLNARALEIASAMGLDQVVAGLKFGYETPLGDGNAETLPTGVRQLITIVRSLARNPSVIIFDEANIALDMKDDELLRNHLAQYKSKCTLILVTHRPSLLALANRVFTLAGGKLSEGSHDAENAGVLTKAEVVPAAIPVRPQHIENFDAIVHQHIRERSDLSNCLLPMLRALRWRGQAHELAEALPHMLRNLDLSGFCSVMGNLNLVPRDFTSSLSKLDCRLLPCLYMPTGRPAMVILERSGDGQFRGIDGASGKEVVIEPESASAMFYVFRPAEKTVGSQRTQSSWFGSLFQRFRRHFILILLLTIFSTLLSLATPMFVRTVYDHVLPSGDIPMQSYLLLGVALAFVLDFSLRRLKNQLTAHVGGRAEYIMGTSIFNRIISLPSTSTDGASVSRQVGRLRNFESLRDYFTGPMALLAFEMPANLIILLAIAILNPWVLIAILGGSIGFALLAWGTRRVSERAVKRSSHAAHKRTEFLNETIAQMSTIRMAGCRATWLSRFSELSGKAVMALYRDHQVHMRINGTAQIIGSLTGLATLAISAYVTIEGKLSSGAMLATMLLVWRLVGPMQNAFHAMNSLVKIRANMQQIENLMRIPTERDGGTRETIRPASRGALSFSRVSFRYSSDADPALLGVSFNVAPGQLVVITGSNGAGKSTLFKLIERTYTPQAGTVRLDNLDIRQLPAADLRARLGYMPQTCELFYGTVTQNLRLAYPAATDDEINWAIEMAGLTQDIAALSDGRETRISNSSAAQLPNGFRQKLSLARAILKPAAIVMLDEPGSGLDDAGETALLRCIAWLRGRSTVLIISHRPGHMRLADFVINMERGSVVATGPFDSIKDKLMGKRT